MNGQLMQKTKIFLANNWFNLLTIFIIATMTVYNGIRQIDTLVQANNIMTERLSRLEIVVEKVVVEFQNHLVVSEGRSKSVENNDNRIDRLEKRIEKLEDYIQRNK